jgi:TRAP-type C4-dicarboxylate transport system substrate-binding protein
VKPWLRALVGAGSCIVFASADAQEIRISHHYDDSNDARGRATRVFVEEAQRRAPDLKFRIYPKLSMGLTSVGQLDALQSGRLEMALYPFSYAAEKIPEASLALLPGLVPSLEIARKLKTTELYDRLQEIAQVNGVRIITWWWSPGGFATKARPVQGPDSIAGLRMRAADPVFERMLQSAGAQTLQVPLPAMRPALEEGKLDGLLTAYETYISLRLSDLLKFVTVGEPTIWMIFHPLLMANSTWDNLTKEQQVAIGGAAEAAEAFFDATQREAEQRLVKLADASGVAVRQLTRPEYDAWLQLARRTAWGDYLRKSPQAERLLLETMQIIMSEFGGGDDRKGEQSRQ